MRVFERPILLLSACLDLQPVRYNGEVVKDDFVLKLREFCEIKTVCPEIGMGLGVPRDKIIVYVKDGEYRLLQPSTSRELTNDMEHFWNNLTANTNLDEIDGVVLKSKSPSCGVSNTKVYKDPEGKVYYGKGKGLFALRLLETFPLLPVEDEGRLKDYGLRDHFLTRLFAYSYWRNFKKNVKSIKDMYDFHRTYKYILMAYSQKYLRQMGQLLASYNGNQNLTDVLNEYEKMFKLALSKKTNVANNTNVLLHIFGHISDFLNSSEKKHFLRIIERYKEGKLPITIPRELLRSWAYRFNDEYVLSQTYLSPYPEELE